MLSKKVRTNPAIPAKAKSTAMVQASQNGIINQKSPLILLTSNSSRRLLHEVLHHPAYTGIIMADGLRRCCELPFTTAQPGDPEITWELHLAPPNRSYLLAPSGRLLGCRGRI